ncbi:MAG: TRAP transporter small permease subunit [Burkholderiales bacterium]
MSDKTISPGSGQHSRDGEAAAPRGGLLPAAPAAPWPLAAFGACVDWAVVAIGALMILLVFLNVLLHVAGRDLAWVTELAELLMVWVTFLGGACATRRGAQMTITEFIDKTHGGHRQLADATVDLVAAATLLLLLVYGANLAVAGWSNQLTVLQIPMSFQYLGLPVGALAMLVWVLWDLWQIARGRSHEQRWGSAC